MPNILEALKSAFNTLVDDEPKPMLNIMEAADVWFYYGMIKEALAVEEADLNTTVDEELRGILADAVAMCTNQANRLEQIMIAEGVPFPPVSEPKPSTNPNDIPLGVKLSDDEISNALAVKIIAMTAKASTAASQCVRTDIGAMWVQFLNEALVFGMTLKSKMRKRGWAKLPPAYAPPGH